MRYILKNPMDVKYVAKRLKEARKTFNYTQRDLARLTGVTNVMISQYETGTVVPHLDVLISMAKALCVTLDYFVLDGKEDKVLHNTETLARHEIKQIQTFIDMLIGYKRDHVTKKKKI